MSSHALFQAAQIIPMNSHISPKNVPKLPLLRNRRRLLILRSSSASPADVDSDTSSTSSLFERCFAAPSAPSVSGNVNPVMKGGKYGAFGAVTLEKSKLELSHQQTNKSSPELATGGGGGDIGKIISYGGGDGGDDDGDDDDYFDDFDDGDEGDEGGMFRRRIILQELFDRKFVDAVLSEWQRTIMDLPAGFRQAYEMGLVSSAQMVKFLAMNARPTASRLISRKLPQGLSRAFIGRLLADPAFMYRFLLEEVATIGCSVWWEIKNRKDRIKQEWDLALINVLTAAACNAKLPNNIFEMSYPLREFDLQKRIQAFLFKAAELCMVGLGTGAVQGALSSTLAKKKEGRLSVTVPTASSNALGYGAFLGIYANLRYQLLCGFDRAMVSHFDVIGVALFFGTALRVLNVQLGETSKRAWLGVEADPLAQSDELLKVYNRTSENVGKPSSSKWFISKNAVVSGLGLLGIKQSNADGSGEPSAPKARRKRIVRKKVAAGSA
ncbi:unnamed protein product [Vicia faba]|uniref:Protein RETICULATA-RELATED 1, chloroplastic n=1 Tax=Vicia faba TaxID=3906 RepID=A0AAV0Z3D8_VICFA|nr:unnamed protein product [Vicia faba]